ncbi:MAG: alanine:cation symporter family protein [Bacteroidaceae bacterium]|nr:alanine:cation symporter family protein [Bacteroidaceae bacterium]
MDFNSLITTVNDAVWTYVLIGALVGCGVWFTVRTRFVQFRMVGEMLRLLTDSAIDTVETTAKGSNAVAASGEPAAAQQPKHISSFQAFAVSVATRVGTGNLAGVASAIAIGGPGAVFWMWLIALIGSATAFVESTLAQLFKQKASDSFIGGPAYYIQRGLHQHWMAVLFAVLITCQFGLSNNSIQANTICHAMHEAFGWDPAWVGAALAVMALFIVFGGIQRIAHVSSIIVPVMAVGYLVLALVVIAMNIEHIPHVVKVIVSDAFGITQVAGGGVGAAMMSGIKRGLFSNEAGEGSAPNVAATASVTHPVKQGLIQALGVFTDTLLVCSCTAFIILIPMLSLPENALAGQTGIALTQTALASQVGSAGPVFVAVAIFLFAFSSIIGNYYYGEANIRFITPNKNVMTAYRVLSAGVMVVFGALASFELVWNIVDFFMAFLTACNLVAIVLLGRYAFRLLDDYRSQKRRGVKEPVFHRHQLPEIEAELECW